jgi:hypothetical protein
MLGVSKQRVSQIIQTQADFPAPDAKLSVGRVWTRSSIEAWILTYNRQPGRRSRSALPAPESRAISRPRTHVRRPAKGATAAADSEGNAPPKGGRCQPGGGQPGTRTQKSTPP